MQLQPSANFFFFLIDYAEAYAFQPNSLDMSVHVFALYECKGCKGFARETFFVSLGLPSTALIWLVVIPTRSFMQTPSSSLSLAFHIPQYSSLFLHEFTSLLFFPDRFIRGWYIGSYPMCHI